MKYIHKVARKFYKIACTRVSVDRKAQTLNGHNALRACAWETKQTQLFK
jgi:hypothetical protein